MTSPFAENDRDYEAMVSRIASKRAIAEKAVGLPSVDERGEMLSAKAKPQAIKLKTDFGSQRDRH